MHSTTSNARFNVGLLAACQAMLFTNNSTLIAINGLAGLALAPRASLATLPVTCWVVGGAIATEILFDWPGLGSALLDGIQSRDRALVSGCVLLLTVTFAVVNLGVDLLYGWLDPQIRYS